MKTLKRHYVIEEDLKELCTRKSNDTSQIIYSIINLLSKLSISVKVIDGNNNGNNNVSELYAGMNLVLTELTNNPQRLQKLENINSLITQEEYDNQRQDILNSI